MIKGIETGAATFCHSLEHRFYWAAISSDAILAKITQTVPGQSFAVSGLLPKTWVGWLAQAAGIMKMKIHQNMVKFCLTLVIMLGVATHIHAHTGLKESTPAADSRVQAVPSQIELIFTGPVRLIKLDVVGDSEPQVTFSPASEPESVYRIPAAGLVNGEYEVAWAAIGADGHTIADSFRFVVDRSSASLAP